MRPSVLIGCVLALMAHASSARAWHYHEHAELGSEGYRAACSMIRSELEALPTVSAAERERLEIACDNLEVTAQLYGQATALAGDRLANPKEFRSNTGGWKAASRKEYYALALVNSSHFHPVAPLQWRRYHRDAIRQALEATKHSGMNAIEGFQIAFFLNAFGDHFLHDIFSAGHMGFNRSASSVAASLAFHHAWNKRGRVVRNRAGDSWRAYGDGLLNSVKNQAGRAQVLEVSTRSAYGLLRTFVFGAVDSAHEVEIWRGLPFVIEASRLPSWAEALFDGDDDGPVLHPLAAINWPAQKDKVLDFRTVTSGPLDGTLPLVSALVGFTVPMPWLNTPSHLSVGASLPIHGQDLRFVTDFAVRTNLGLSSDGLMHHRLRAGFLWQVRKDDFHGSLYGGYEVGIELGLNTVVLHAGPALRFNDQRFGFVAGLSYARVLSASGGGVR